MPKLRKNSRVDSFGYYAPYRHSNLRFNRSGPVWKIQAFLISGSLCKRKRLDFLLNRQIRRPDG